MPISSSLVTVHDCSIVAIRRSLVFCTTSLIPYQPKSVPICTLIWVDRRKCVSKDTRQIRCSNSRPCLGIMSLELYRWPWDTYFLLYYRFDSHDNLAFLSILINLSPKVYFKKKNSTSPISCNTVGLRRHNWMHFANRP